MKQIKYGFILEAEQPVAHHSENLGNMALLMRQDVRQRDGSFKSVPYITGDTLRHGLREACAYAYLQAAGLLETPSLSEGALRLLFSGGMLTGKGDTGSVKLDEYRESVEIFPALGLFGGCAGNRCIPGRLCVSPAQLVCDETLHYLPEEVLAYLAETGQEIHGHRRYVEEATRVRMDSLLDPGKRLLLEAGERARVEQRLLASESASEKDDAKGKEEAKSTMLPRSFERIKQGSLFYWEVEATTYDALGEDTFKVAVGVFLQRAYVGGKRSTGHGKLRVAKGFAFPGVFCREPAGEAELGTPIGGLFWRHVEERKERIAKWLSKVNA